MALAVASCAAATPFGSSSKTTQRDGGRRSLIEPTRYDCSGVSQPSSAETHASKKELRPAFSSTCSTLALSSEVPAQAQQGTWYSCSSWSHCRTPSDGVNSRAPIIAALASKC